MIKRGHLHRLFPTTLYVADVDGADTLNEMLLSKIHDLRDDDLTNIKDPELLATFQNEVWTTYFSRPGVGLINEDWTGSLQSAVLQHVREFVSMLELDFGTRNPRVTTLFANIHDQPFHRHDAHTHPGSMFSGSYYVKTDPGAGRFRFVNPARALKFHEFSAQQDSELNVDEVSLDPVAGRLVLFQSHVPHAVDRQTMQGERVAISFNINYE